MKNLKLWSVSVLLCAMLCMSACANDSAKSSSTSAEAANTKMASEKAEDSMQSENTAQGAMTITAKEAKEIMDSETGYIILDVRNDDEFAQGHVPNAILIPLSELESRAAAELPDKNQQILLYCRSGNRSGQAAKLLEGLGYTNVKDFGGIIDWPYEIEK